MKSRQDFKSLADYIIYLDTYMNIQFMSAMLASGKFTKCDIKTAERITEEMHRSLDLKRYEDEINTRNA